MTYRENAYKEPKAPMDTRWIWRALGAIGAVALFGFAAGSGAECEHWNKVHPEPPVIPECHDSAEIISISDSARICNPGARIDTAVLPSDSNKYLVRCYCQSVADASVADSAYDAAANVEKNGR